MRDTVTTIDALAEAMTEITRETLSHHLVFVDATRAALAKIREEREAVLRSVEVALRSHDKLMKALGGKNRAPTKLPRPRGRPPYAAVRERQIAQAVIDVVHYGPFKPTRSHTRRDTRARREHSACGIVQTALARLGEHRSERSIEDIWDRYRGKLPPSLPLPD